MKRSSFLKSMVVLFVNPLTIASSLQSEWPKEPEFETKYGEIIRLKRQNLVLKIKPSGKRIDMSNYDQFSNRDPWYTSVDINTLSPRNKIFFKSLMEDMAKKAS